MDGKQMHYLDLIKLHWRNNPDFRFRMVLILFCIISFIVGYMSGYGNGIGDNFNDEKIVLLEKLPNVCAQYYCDRNSVPDMNAIKLDFNIIDLNVRNKQNTSNAK